MLLEAVNGQNAPTRWLHSGGTTLCRRFGYVLLPYKCYQVGSGGERALGEIRVYPFTCLLQELLGLRATVRGKLPKTFRYEHEMAWYASRLGVQPRAFRVLKEDEHDTADNDPVRGASATCVC